MSAELRERREETWERLIVQGEGYTTVVAEVSERYDVSRAAIEKDIQRMDNWLPKLDQLALDSGLSRIRELRQNRQRLQRMAAEAADGDDERLEMKLRRLLNKSIELDIDLSQSLGMTEKEPEEVEVGWRQYMEAADAAASDSTEDGDGDGTDSTDDVITSP